MKLSGAGYLSPRRLLVILKFYKLISPVKTKVAPPVIYTVSSV